MAKDTKQVSDSFSIATFIRLLISILFFWIGILLLSHNPNLDSNTLFAYIIDNFTFILGFRGIIATGILAMVMSTNDTFNQYNYNFIVIKIANSFNNNCLYSLYKYKVL